VPNPTLPALASNTEWLCDTSLLGDELSSLLKAVHASRPVGEQFWVDFFPVVGNPNFDRELGYGNLNTIDAGYRLLAMYRFWSIVEYWSPNRGIIGENWVDVLNDFVPPMALASDKTEYKRTMLRLVARLNDTHTQLYPAYDVQPPTRIASVPVVVRWIENQAVISGWTLEPDGPETTLQIGDVILAVDGQKTEDLMAEWAPFYSASNEPQRNSRMASALVAFRRRLHGPGPDQKRHRHRRH